MNGILALVGVALVLAVAVLVGRKSEPFELEKEVAPGIKPFVPSEEMGIFGTSRVHVQEILAQNFEPIPLQEWENSPQVELALGQAEQLLFEEQLEPAAEILAKALAQEKDNPDLLLALGDVYRQLSRYAESLNLYMQADKVVPGDVLTLLKLGEILELLERPGEALQAYLQVQTINPDDAEAADGVERLGKHRED